MTSPREELTTQMFIYYTNVYSLLPFVSSRREKESMKVESTALAGQRKTSALARVIQRSAACSRRLTICCFVRPIGLVVECSPMGWETGVQSQVELYQRLKKWYLIPPCLTLSIIRYVSRVKWSNPGKGVAPSPTPQCSSYWKGSFRGALDYSHQLYFFL